MMKNRPKERGTGLSTKALYLTYTTGYFMATYRLFSFRSEEILLFSVSQVLLTLGYVWLMLIAKDSDRELMSLEEKRNEITEEIEQLKMKKIGLESDYQFTKKLIAGKKESLEKTLARLKEYSVKLSERRRVLDIYSKRMDDLADHPEVLANKKLNSIEEEG